MEENVEDSNLTKQGLKRPRIECDFCYEELNSPPYLLPCGYNVCEKHVVEGYMSKCEICLITHNELKTNKKIKNIIDGKIKPIESDKVNELNENFCETVNKLKSIKQNAEFFSSQQKAELRNQVDISREKVILLVHNHYDNQMLEIDKVCDDNLNKIKSNFEFLDNSILNLELLKNNFINSIDNNKPMVISNILRDNFENEINHIKSRVRDLDVSGRFKIKNYDENQIVSNIGSLTKNYSFGNDLDISLNNLKVSRCRVSEYFHKCCFNYENQTLVTIRKSMKKKLMICVHTFKHYKRLETLKVKEVPYTANEYYSSGDNSYFQCVAYGRYLYVMDGKYFTVFDILTFKIVYSDEDITGENLTRHCGMVFGKNYNTLFIGFENKLAILDISIPASPTLTIKTLNDTPLDLLYFDDKLFILFSKKVYMFLLDLINIEKEFKIGNMRGDISFRKMSSTCLAIISEDTTIIWDFDLDEKLILNEEIGFELFLIKENKLLNISDLRLVYDIDTKKKIKTDRIFRYSDEGLMSCVIDRNAILSVYSNSDMVLVRNSDLDTEPNEVEYESDCNECGDDDEKSYTHHLFGDV